jgi:TRAP-type C4-dicarboxylate transport system substrate-binding protein
LSGLLLGLKQPGGFSIRRNTNTGLVSGEKWRGLVNARSKLMISISCGKEVSLMGVSSTKKKVVLILGIMVLLFFCLANCEAAESVKGKELKWALHIGENTFDTPPVKKFRDDIEAYTNGSIKPKIYWAGQIAEVKELVELCRSGTVEMTSIAPGYNVSSFPLNSTLQQFPMLLKNPEQATYVWRGLFRDCPELQEEYAKQNQYCLNRASLSSYLTISKKPLRTVADLRGLKIRGHMGKYYAQVYKLAGATHTYLPVPDLYEGLLRNTLDAVVINVQSFDSLRLWEAAKYVSIDTGSIVAWHTAINLDVWNGFTLEVKKAFERAATEWGARDLELNLATESKSIEVLKGKGVQFITFDQKEWEDLLAKAGDPWLAAKDYLVNDLKVNVAVADRFIKRWRELADEYEQNYLSTGRKWEYK